MSRRAWPMSQARNERRAAQRQEEETYAVEKERRRQVDAALDEASPSPSASSDSSQSPRNAPRRAYGVRAPSRGCGF